ncbi:MAG: DUF4139 domain-containing protein [Burkholderiaceae bacterium]
MEPRSLPHVPPRGRRAGAVLLGTAAALAVPVVPTAAQPIARPVAPSAAMPPTAPADATPRIVAATIYPDSARVERALDVSGGTRHVTIACVPAAVDVSTLQVDGDAQVQVGDVRAGDLPESRVDECAPQAAPGRRDALARQRSELESQRDANELALAWLRQWSGHGADDASPAAPAPSRGPAGAALPRPGATATELRRAALDLMTDQARVKRELDALGRAEVRLADEQPAGVGKEGWRTLRFDVWTPGPASLRVRYAVSNAYWRPSYRVGVDTARGTMRLDRQAEVVQGSGEDWTGVRVKLETSRARRRAAVEPPRSWWLDLVQPMLAAAAADATSAMRPMAAPAPVMPKEAADARRARAAQEPPPWAVQEIAGEDATEFVVAQPVDAPSDGQARTFTIASQTLPATIVRRAVPRADRAVYLLARAERPAGAWPAGPLQAYRDGTLVGRVDWQPALGRKLEVALGQDDRMRVDVETPGDVTGSAGIFGGRGQKRAASVYAIANQHGTPVTVEVLDAAPVARDEAIRVETRFDPPPATTEWDHRAGVAAWTLSIAPQQTQRIRVEHVVSWPKERQVSALP